MILGSHNSWSYNKPKKWWMKLIAFTARCQNIDIKTQYELGVRCFDLRIRFDKDCNTVFAHGIIEYNIDADKVYDDLKWLDNKGDCYVRVIHEARNRPQYSNESISNFQYTCKELQCSFTNIKFWCGKSIYNWEHNDYEFDYQPSCEEKYASVCAPKLIDDWYPRWFAKHHNKEIKEEGTEKDILLIDFVNIG